MEKRKLGRSKLEVSAIGLGCASMSGSYGEPDEQEAIASTIRLAFADYDENLIDSEELRNFLKQIKYDY